MGLMDSLRKLTQPYGDEDDYFEGASGDYTSQDASPSSEAQLEFESSFAEDPSVAPEPAKKTRSPGSFFSGRGEAKTASRSSSKPSRLGRGKNNAVSADQSVVRFNPKNFDEAGELVSFLEQGRSLLMSLEEIPSDTARRLLDFMSGIAFALNGKITPVSAKTYFITPENVDLLDAQDAPAEND